MPAGRRQADRPDPQCLNHQTSGTKLEKSGSITFVRFPQAIVFVKIRYKGYPMTLLGRSCTKRLEIKCS